MSNRACEQCYSIKQRCDRNSPCGRCSRLQLDCTLVPPKAGSNRVHKVPFVRRTRLGCDTCKKRKKKCDEKRPKCSDCQRLNLPCVRTTPTVSPRETRIPEIQSPSNFSTTSDAADFHNARSYTDNALPLTPDPPATGTTDSTRADDFELAPRLKPVYEWLSDDIFHSRLAETIQYSDVLNSSDLDLEAVFDGGEEPDFSFGSEPELESPWLPLNPLTIPFSLTISPLDQLSNSQDKHLFQHFTHIVSRSLSIACTDDENPFLKLLIPMASTSNVVMGAMLALSSIHLKHNGATLEIVERGLDLQTKSLTALNNLIGSGSSVVFSKEQALATILLFCIIDIREGNSSRWNWHIAAAKAVITSAEQTSSSPHTAAWPFLLDIFSLVDSIITVSRCQPPQIDHEELPLEDYDTSSSHGTSLSGKSYRLNMVFGVARPLFREICQISSLSSQRKDRMKPHFDARYRKCAAELNSRLHAWEPPNSSYCFLSNRSSENLRESHFKETVHAAIAIKWASILRLHQIVDGYALPHPVPTECLQNILVCLHHIRVGSAVESLMVFPLIMAASVALSREDRMTIRSRWLIMERTIGFGNIAKGGKLQEQVWEAMDAEIDRDDLEPGKVTVNWASIRWNEYEAFVMF